MPTTLVSDQTRQPNAPAARSFVIFDEFAREMRDHTVLRAGITAAYRRPEHEAVAMLLESARLAPDQPPARQ